jgi:kynureninase
MARLVGAHTDEVVVMNALSVNLHLMMVSFYGPEATRRRVLIEPHAFPSDRYAVASQVRFHGYDPDTEVLELPLRPGEETVRTEDFIRYLYDEGRGISLVLLGGVNYYTGQFFDIPTITNAAHAAGCIVGLDLAHAVGNVPLRLHEWDVDFAVWCTYKYLNSGPGGPGACFVHERHHKETGIPRFEGWWGNSLLSRFDMKPTFEPEAGARAWQLSNPSMLSRAGLRASLALFDRIGMAAIREKSERLTRFCEEMIRDSCDGIVRIVTPGDPASRGAQLSLDVGPNAERINDRLRAAGIVCDWRRPNVIRVAPAPLYNSFGDVYQFVMAMAEALAL